MPSICRNREAGGRFQNNFPPSIERLRSYATVPPAKVIRVKDTYTLMTSLKPAMGWAFLSRMIQNVFAQATREIAPSEWYKHVSLHSGNRHRTNASSGRDGL